MIKPIHEVSQNKHSQTIYTLIERDEANKPWYEYFIFSNR